MSKKRKRKKITIEIHIRDSLLILLLMCSPRVLELIQRLEESS